MVPPPGSLPLGVSHAIDLIEIVYDLDKPEPEWLDAITEVGKPLFDQGLGFAIDEFSVRRCDGGATMSIGNVRAVELPSDYAKRLAEAASLLPPEMVPKVSPPGYAGTWTEISEGYPEESKRVLQKLGYRDLLGILARDPNGIGIRIVAPLPDATKLVPKSREQWQMLAAHIAAAYRLRHALASGGILEDARNSGLPRGAEAVVDPRKLHVVDAVHRARHESAVECLRRGARWIDRARSSKDQRNYEEALQTWRALVCGRWSLVDWFDTDERRFLLAMPNPPEVRDPRGLNEQECQVVEYVVLGDSNKLIAYRLGLSQARVSTLLRSAMKKLGVKTRAQLIEKLPPLPIWLAASGERAAG